MRSLVDALFASRRPIVYSRRSFRIPRALALTFDDGPSRWTPEILDALAGAGAMATFFVLGASIDGNEDVLRRAARDGHELANHGFTHRDPATLSDDELADELRRTNAAVSAVTGVTPRIFRPPYAETDLHVARVGASVGLAPMVLRSVDPADWDTPDAGVIVRHVLERAHRGAIVCMHDGIPPQGTGSVPTRDATVQAVRELVAELPRRGYSLVTVSELLQ